MNPEFEEILNRLKQIEDSVNENKSMLESIQRRAHITMIFSALKWFIIIGLTFGIFYYTKPYLEKMLDLYMQVNSLTNTVTNPQKQTDALLKELKSLLE